MIVLDEQLLGRNLESKIARWYQGTVCYITDLRPGTVIKDEAIPKLLQQRAQPTFVTINERDFWRKTAISAKFCVVGFALPDARANEIAVRLRSVFQHPLFKTKKNRMGQVIRVTDRDVSHYTVLDRKIRQVEF